MDTKWLRACQLNVFTGQTRRPLHFQHVTVSQKELFNSFRLDPLLDPVHCGEGGGVCFSFTPTRSFYIHPFIGALHSTVKLGHEYSSLSLRRKESEHPVYLSQRGDGRTHAWGSRKSLCSRGKQSLQAQGSTCATHTDLLFFPSPLPFLLETLVPIT